MAIYRAQISFPVTSALPRDAITINPHFSGDNPQALADALKANLIANANVTVTTPFTVKVYDEQKAPPSYPLATATNGTGFGTANLPRELAMCLSYYSSPNTPRRRGRLYIPGHLLGVATFAVRPSASTITNTLAWRMVVASGLPPNTNFGVWSVKDAAFVTCNQFWVDDEWDIVRSRGLRGTTRQTATQP